MKKLIFLFFGIVLAFLALLSIDLLLLYSGCVKNIKCPDKHYSLERDYLFSPFEERTDWATKYKLNSQGLRNEEVSRIKRPGEVRILFMGDSCTFGTGSWLEPSQTYPKVAENILKDKCFPSNVITINGGIPGYSSFQGYQLLRVLVKEYTPDIATIYYGWNDHWVDVLSDKNKYLLNYADYYLNRSAVFFLIQRAFLGNDDFIRPFRYSRIWKNNKKIVRVSLEDYRKNIENMISLCRKNNVKVILFTAPSNTIDELPGQGWFSKQPFFTLGLHPKYNQIVRETALKEHVLLFDLDAEIEKHEKKDSLFNGFVHFNKEGHKLAGELFAEYAVKEGLIKN